MQTPENGGGSPPPDANSWINALLSVPKDIDLELNYILQRDDKDEFIQYIGSSEYKETIAKFLWHSLFENDSVNIATAVLSGEVDDMFNLSAYCSDVGWTPLHAAASYSAPDITALFLRNKFAADDRSDFADWNLKEALPLNVALTRIRLLDFMCDWYRRKSAIHLVIKLCYPEVHRSLETVRLLVQASKDASSEFLKYLKEGRMVELGALLIVAYDQFLPLLGRKYFYGSNKVHDTHEILSIFHSADGNRSLFADVSHNQPSLCKDKLKEKAGIPSLLDIFERIGGKLAAYVELCRDHQLMDDHSVLGVLSILRKAGFSVSIEDTYIPESVYRSMNVRFDQEILRRRYKVDDLTWGTSKQSNYVDDLVRKIRSGSGFRSLRSLHTTSSVLGGMGALSQPKRSMYSCRRYVTFVMALKRGLRHV